MKKTESDLPILPPIDFDPPSNGEYCPIGPTEVGQKRWALWKSIVEEKHRRLGMTRRQFAESACGTAAWLFTINRDRLSSNGTNPGDTSTGGASGQGGRGGGAGGPGTGGSSGGEGGGGTPGKGGSGGSASPDGALGGDTAGYDVQRDMLEDMGAARQALSGNEFIFDVQTHVQPTEVPWNGNRPPNQVLTFMSQIFVESETTVACITGTPDTRNQGPAWNRARTQMLELMERYGGSGCCSTATPNPSATASRRYMAQAAGPVQEHRRLEGLPAGAASPTAWPTTTSSTPTSRRPRGSEHQDHRHAPGHQR